MLMAKSRRGVLVSILLAALPFSVMGAGPSIGFGGTGDIKLGTPLSRMLTRLEQPIRKTDQQPDGHCFYARPENDRRLALMFEADVLTRIDVMQPGLATAAGIQVGDPASKVWEQYGEAIKDEPDAYDDRERYLTLSSNDGKYAIRFMTNNRKISAIISGTTKSVEYVDGCL